MEQQPLVSVLMTAYNRGKYIADAIESVQASTYQNFELIIVDDCSTDNTLEIAQDYERKDARIKVLKNEKNLTQFGNRNKAAGCANGTYIKYVDSDDIIYPCTLKYMVECMKKFPEAALGFCLTVSSPKKPLPYAIEPNDAFKQHFFDGGLLFVGPSGWIIKRDKFEEVKGFEEFGMPSDNHFALKLASKYPVVAFPSDLFWWRVHEGQVYVQNKGNHYNILNNYNYCVDIVKNYSPLYSRENNKLLKIYNQIFWKHIVTLAFRSFKPALAFKILVKRMEQGSK